MRKTVLTILFAAMLPLGLMAQITEPGATEPTQLYTTTYDNPSGPNHAPGGPNRISGNANESEENPGTQSNQYPIGAPWILLGFAVVYGATQVIRKRKDLKA